MIFIIILLCIIASLTIYSAFSKDDDDETKPSAGGRVASAIASLIEFLFSW